MESVCLVVVTYNRLNELKRLMNYVNQQSKKVDKIIVVNNGSTDGTNEWINSQNYIYQIIQENKGSAGGFYIGLVKALEFGFEYVWIMDDDGYPEENNLFELWKHRKADEIIASVCISDEDKETLSFPYTDKKTGRKFEKYSELKLHFNDLIKDWASPYNSLLISKNILSNNGLPNPKLFIWGDEVEYFFRLKKMGVKFNTALKSIQYHPINRQKFTSYRGSKYYDNKIDWRAYCYFRNQAFISRNDFKFFGIRTLLKNVIFRLKKDGIFLGLKNSLLIIKAHFHGVFGILNKKLPF